MSKLVVKTTNAKATSMATISSLPTMEMLAGTTPFGSITITKEQRILYGTSLNYLVATLYSWTPTTVKMSTDASAITLLTMVIHQEITLSGKLKRKSIA